MVSLPGNPMLRCLGPRYPRLIAAACQTFFTGPLLRKRLPVNGGKNEKCSFVHLAFNKLSLACFLTGKKWEKSEAGVLFDIQELHHFVSHPQEQISDSNLRIYADVNDTKLPLYCTLLRQPWPISDSLPFRPFFTLPAQIYTREAFILSIQIYESVRERSLLSVNMRVAPVCWKFWEKKSARRETIPVRPVLWLSSSIVNTSS